MRINIEIDDDLMSKALKASGAKTEREAVKLALQTLLRLESQSQIRNLRGRLEWTGDIGALRLDT